MAIIEGAQICTTDMRRRARQVIDSMIALLAARRVHRVSRKAFLIQWDHLRTALFLTPEYRDLRQLIFQRCEGICERCGTTPFAHVHHVVPVAYEPNLALLPSNCKGLCVDCHRREHEANAA